MPAYVPPALRNKAPGSVDANPGDSAIDSTLEPENASTDRSTSYNTTLESFANYGNRTNRFPQRHQDDAEYYTVQEIHHHYWPNSAAQAADGEKPKFSTLNGSEQDPRKLVYVVSFKGANPRWKEGILFAKTNLEFLKPEKGEERVEDNSQSRGESSAEPPSPDTSKLPGHPIATYTQIGGLRGQSARNFCFTGYRTITAIDFLEPNSPELVKMLGQKWHQPNVAPPNPASATTSIDVSDPTTSSTADAAANDVAPSAENSRLAGWGKPMPRGKVRGPEQWKESLRLEWAVVKFKKCPKADELESPKIEKIGLDKDEDDGGGGGRGGNVEGVTVEKKSVNEMLKEMRLKDQA